MAPAAHITVARGSRPYGCVFQFLFDFAHCFRSAVISLMWLWSLHHLDLRAMAPGAHIRHLYQCEVALCWDSPLMRLMHQKARKLETEVMIASVISLLL
jgi:hypothetical protein